MSFVRQTNDRFSTVHELGHELGKPQIIRTPADYRLTTAEILYHLPDHPNVLQSFIWQQLDIAPDYPVLHKFLDFWKREIEGTLHSVRIASARLGRRGRMTHADTLLHVH